MQPYRTAGQTAEDLDRNDEVLAGIARQYLDSGDKEDMVMQAITMAREFTQRMAQTRRDMDHYGPSLVTAHLLDKFEEVAPIRG